MIWALLLRIVHQEQSGDMIIKFVLRGLIRGYQLLISPLLGNCCRYHPSCSRYALDALETCRADHAIILIIKRIMRCHPWAEGGLDPVPTCCKKSRLK